MTDDFHQLETLYHRKTYLVKAFARRHSLEKAREISVALIEINQQVQTIMEAPQFQDSLQREIGNPIARNNALKWIFGDTGVSSCLRAENDALAKLLESADQTSVERAALRDLLRAEMRMYRSFQRDYAARFQERLKLKVVGYGEISTVLRFSGGLAHGMDRADRDRWVYKKMPLFSDEKNLQNYIDIFEEYRRLFVEEIGIQIPQQKTWVHKIEPDKIRLYVLQERFDPDCVGHKLIHHFSEEMCARLLTMILLELKKVWQYNASQGRLKVAIDAQISNWVVTGFDPQHGDFRSADTLVYIDTSSPLFRVNGEEQLDAELFLKRTPFFLRPIIRALFLQEVLDRYYDAHLVTVDLIANFFKEGRAEYIPRMIETANRFFSAEMPSQNIEAITEREVEKYYKGDAFIWKFYLAARKVDRFITEKLLRRKYEFRLPEKVKR